MVIRVMSILQGASGDPKDRYVNNFHFSDAQSLGIRPDLVANVSGALDDFWDALDPYIPNDVTREDYRFYDLTDETPRPVTFATATAQPSGSGTRYPFEVAACLSYYAGRNIRRRRGRIYIGPLTSNVAGVGEVNSDPQVNSAFRTAAVNAAAALQADVESAGGNGSTTWGVFSPTDNTLRSITHAWMDNAFDTVRARGSASTQRTVLEFP